MAENIRLLSVGQTIRLAWEKTYGAKKTVWAAIGMMFLILFVLALFIAIIQASLLGSTLQSKQTMVFGNIFPLISYLFQMGILLIGIKRAYDLPINYRLMFNAFNVYTAIKLLVLYLLQVLILLVIFIPYIAITVLFSTFSADISKDFFSGIIFILTIFAVIYTIVRMFLAPGITIDKKVYPWKAIQLSFMYTKDNFWRLFCVTIIEMACLAISIIPLGIGLIWSIPFMIVCYGVIYRSLAIEPPATIVQPASTIT